jgi:hypothetical protein
MIDVDMLDDEVLNNILSNLGLDDGEWDTNPAKAEALVERVKQMSERELFNRFLIWNGIIGYTDVITTAIDSIRAAKQEDL